MPWILLKATVNNGHSVARFSFQRKTRLDIDTIGEKNFCHWILCCSRKRDCPSPEDMELAVNNQRIKLFAVLAASAVVAFHGHVWSFQATVYPECAQVLIQSLPFKDKKNGVWRPKISQEKILKPKIEVLEHLCLCAILYTKQERHHISSQSLYHV